MNHMITRGSLIAISLTALTLGVVTGSYMSSPTNSLSKSISDANTLFKNENLEVEVDGLRVKATGRVTMEVVQILREMLSVTESEVFPDEYSPYTPPLEKQIMRKQDSYLQTMYSQKN